MSPIAWLKGDFGRQVFAGAAGFMLLTFVFVVPLVDRLARNNVLESLAIRLDEAAELNVEALDAELSRLDQDVRFLGQTPPIQGIARAINEGGIDAVDNSSLDSWKKRLQAIFVAYLENHPGVQQVRYIGMADGGRELVRVDRNAEQAVVIPESRLQRKGDRDYFRDMLNYGPGEVYVSEINLNREFGKVQVPHLPTVRLGLPVFHNQQRFGLLVINVSMRGWLNQLASHDNTLQTYLLNHKGDFLAHPDASRAFGFDLGSPYRWQDEFSSDTSELPELADRLGVQALNGMAGALYAKKVKVDFGHERENRFLTIAVTAPSSMVGKSVSLAHQIVLSILLVVAAVGGALLYLVVLNVVRREQVGIQNAQMAAIIDSSTDAIVGKTLRGEITSWNRAAENMFGYTAREAIGRTVQELLLPEDRQAEEEHILDCVGRGEIVPHFETVRRRSDGSQIDVSVTVSPVRSPDGHIVGAAKVARDISQEKATRWEILELNARLEDKVKLRTRELEEAMALQSAIINHAGYAIIATLPDGTITQFNPAAEKLLGYSAEEVLGKPPPNAMHDAGEVMQRAAELTEELGEPIEPGFEVIVARARRGLPDEQEWTHIRKNGERIPVRLNISALTKPDGELTGFLGIAVDLSEQKKQQAELLRSKAEADAANRAKSEFLANMSHEIRTPINAIMGLLDLIRYTELSDQQRGYTDKAQAAARTLLGIINDVLDFSKIEAGKVVLDPQPVVLDELLREVAHIVGPSAGEKSLEIVFDLDPGLPQAVVLDPLRLQQVLLNLIGNAIKFTDQGKVILTLRSLRDAHGKLRLLFRIEDTGIGMSPEQRQRVFEAFTQAEAGITRRYGGTGLGLVISQRLIEIMGGTLAMQSELGKGSAFSFELETMPAKHAVTASQSKLENLQGLRVLVVDDHKEARSAIAANARSLSWRAEQAGAGREAIDRVKAADREGDPYRVVFLDWSIPAIDGAGVAESIQGLTLRHPQPWMILMSAYEDDALKQKMQEGSQVACAFLGKPVTPSDMMNAVMDMMGVGEAVQKQDGKIRSQALKDMHLLLVEDNATNQIVARDLLEAAGAAVAVADNGLEAVNRLREAGDHYDCVLMDLQMPVMDGFTATRTIREELGMKEMPIIAMTANAMASDRQACLEAGMNEHVGKPFHIEHLVGLILSMVRGSAPPSETTPATESEEMAPSSDRAFNMEAALERMGNNQRLYAEQARQFVDQYEHTLQGEVKNLLLSGDRNEAARAVHSLRGVAGTLGAQELFTQLTALENAIKDDVDWQLIEPILATANVAMKAARKTLCDYVAAMDEKNGVAITPQREQADPYTLLKELASLETLLKERNLRAMEVCAKLLDKTADERAGQLQAAITSMDFTRALSLVEEWKPDLESAIDS